MQLQDLGTSLIEMWSLMDTSSEEQQLFQHVTCILSMSEDEVCAPQALALDNIEQVSRVMQCHWCCHHFSNCTVLVGINLHDSGGG